MPSTLLHEIRKQACADVTPRRVAEDAARVEALGAVAPPGFGVHTRWFEHTEASEHAVVVRAVRLQGVCAPARAAASRDAPGARISVRRRWGSSCSISGAGAEARGAKQQHEQPHVRPYAREATCYVV